MRNFIIIWLGQTVSLIGSRMSAFAITIWAWELTNQVTTLAWVGFFTQIPAILVTLFAGVIVDRYNRKFLMVIGDGVTGLSTIAILLLHLTNNLQIWHLYVIFAIAGIFGQLQELAYSASVSLMVPKQHYSRASSIGFLASYGSSIIAPALAGSIYYIIGLNGILTIDIASFVIAIATVLWLPIPQPNLTESSSKNRFNIIQDISFGFRYIMARKDLLAILLLASLFWFAHDVGGSVYAPMILARTGNDAKVLGIVSSAAGLGGVFGGLLVTVWGGPKRKIQGFLLGMIGAGLSKIVFGLGQNLFIWIPAQFCSSINFPIMGSSGEAIWLANVNPDVQGRVFAIRSVLKLVMSTIAYLIAGPLADRVFEPAMKPGGSFAFVFGNIFGVGTGAGIALLYVISSICLLFVGFSGYAFYRILR